MRDMFRDCGSIERIYVGANWSTSNVTDGEEMFFGCESLVGGEGTTYNSSKLDKTYAIIDGGTSNPGYFSVKP